MRAILLLMVIAGGCSSNSPLVLEFDIGVNAPSAASVLIDGNIMLPPTNGVLSRGYPSLTEAMKVAGTVESRDADGTVRASTHYSFGTYCATHMPLLREVERFIETADAAGTPSMTLDSIECVLTDGTGVVVAP
ncbi:MAG: hypothetical protein JWN44_7166 [Myxococcales bacterium]|nr:hypothetical protein [Myxococcales bacterium]